MPEYSLVADVGGTNARLALCDISTGAIDHIQRYPTAGWDSLEKVILHYLDSVDYPIRSSCIAIACPVSEDRVEMTNHHWSFSVQQLKKSLSLSHICVINDFTAASMAVPVLNEDDVLQLGGQVARKDHPVAVFGAGTGLGCAYLIRHQNGWLSLPGEGGHSDLTVNGVEEMRILSVLQQKFGHVSAELVLSGNGLINLYQAIMTLNHRQPECFQASDITERAVSGQCPICRQALSMFCVFLGRFGGNLALNLVTHGGVYIAGGIVPKFREFLQQSGFRAAFEDKGRFAGFLKKIPVYLITHEQPGLIGAGAYLRQQLGLVLA